MKLSRETLTNATLELSRQIGKLPGLQIRATLEKIAGWNPTLDAHLGGMALLCCWSNHVTSPRLLQRDGTAAIEGMADVKQTLRNRGDCEGFRMPAPFAAR
ncbi:MAG: hypothetical protein Q8M19_22800 [Reyranella sp.]|nr:hypothetical protein [Reyranella sp.]